MFLIVAAIKQVVEQKLLHRPGIMKIVLNQYADFFGSIFLLIIDITQPKNCSP
jgi:hypothetical protein